jgi:hypothetical protein
VEQLPSIAELPDPFVFQDGTRVKTPLDWQRRRAELAQLLLYYQYGRMPPPFGNVKGEELSSTPNQELEATEKRIKLTMGPGAKLTVPLELTIPLGRGPFPVIIRGDLCWGKAKPPIPQKVIQRGYILAEFDRTAIVPDKNDRTQAAWALYPEFDWGALSAWAWGFHRVVDYLVTLDYVDPQRIAVTGHSRGGKTALLAGALDERIALTVPNNSGCGGAGCYRHQGPKSEDIRAITSRFPHWFSPRFPQFVGRVHRLPFDQHSLKALVAPRALLTTEALGDLWANPEGTQVSHQAAKPVFEFLGAGEKLGIYFRPGKHEHNADDWEVLLDFADWQLRGKPPTRRFDQPMPANP